MTGSGILSRIASASVALNQHVILGNANDLTIRLHSVYLEQREPSNVSRWTSG